MSIKDYAGYESYEQMLRHAYHHGGGVDLDYDGVKEIIRLLDRNKRVVSGRRFTHFVDSYGINIYEGDEILDEVAGTTDFVVDYKGTWYLGDKNGYTLSGQLSSHLQRRCKVVE